jgi:hypothetical protein
LPLAFNRSGVSRHTANPSAADQARISDVKQDSDFPWEITVRIFAVQNILPSPLVRRAAKQSVFFSPQNTNLVPEK